MPSPSQSQNPGKKGWVWAIIILSAILLFSLLSLIWQSTAAMPWRMTPFMQSVRSGTNSVSLAIPPGEPMMDAMLGNVGIREAEEMMKYGEPTIMPAPTGGATPEDRARVGEHVIRNGSLSVRVDDAEKRLEEVRTIVSSEGGFVANANIVNREGIRMAQATLRVPQDAFDRTLLQIKKLASTVFNESSNAEDVTAQFVDLEARLNAAKAEEAQYLRILEQAKTIEDTLKVTARLGEVRSRIESMEGQLRYMNDRTEYATISVSMTEEARVQIPSTVWRPGETLHESLRQLVVSLQGLADALIAFGVFLIGLALPIAIVVILIVKIVRITRKKLRSKK